MPSWTISDSTAVIIASIMDTTQFPRYYHLFPKIERGHVNTSFQG